MQTTPLIVTGPAPTITQTRRERPTLYLCGPINGRTDKDCKDWREFVKTHWEGTCLDPMSRDARGKKMDPNLAEEIVDGDLLDIRQSDALLVYYDKPSVGTSMEIFYAATMAHKPVFLINASGNSELSPWLIHHTHVVFPVLDEPILRIIYGNLVKT